MTSAHLRPHSALLWLLVLFGGLLSLMGAAARGAVPSASTVVITRGLDGGPALTGAASEYVSASADGRYVAFLSNASNFGHDPKGRVQVCVKDRVTGLVRLASRAANGDAANGDCYVPAISADGRCVVYISDANNLGGSYPFYQQIFWHDLQSGLTLRVANGRTVPSFQEPSTRTVAINADGRYVAFGSFDATLTPGDTNFRMDVFVWDRQTGAYERASVGTGGTEGNESSGDMGVAISGDGQVVAFSSFATNLSAGDPNQAPDIFVRNRATGTTQLVSRSLQGQPLDGWSTDPAISGNGNRVAFVTWSGNLFAGQQGGVPAIVVWDRTTSLATIATNSVFGNPAFGAYAFPALSTDGRYLAFRASATDLVAGSSFGSGSAFVRDLLTGAIQQVNLPAGGGGSEGDLRNMGPTAISSDGNLVFFQSRPGDLVAGDDNGRADVFVRNRAQGTTVRLSVAADGSPALAGARSRNPVVSADGRYVAFVSDAFNLVPGDTNGEDDVFVWDRQGGTLERANVSSAEQQAQPRSQMYDEHEVGIAMSANGRYVAFTSPAGNLIGNDTNHSVDLFVRDRQLGTTERINVAFGGLQSSGGVSSGPAMSADGRYVAFRSGSPDLVAGDTNEREDVFVRDRLMQFNELVSVRSAGGQSTDPVFDWSVSDLTPSISADGRFVAWSTHAADLVPGDTNGVSDIFVRDRHFNTTTLASVSSSGTPGDGGSFEPRLSGDGQRVAFSTWSQNLASDDPNQWLNVYLRNLVGGTTERLDRDNAGEGATGESRIHAFSADGRYGLFESTDPLAAGDFNGGRDLFLRDRNLGQTTRVSLGESGGEGLGAAFYLGAAMSPNARYIVFSTDAENLVGGDTDRNFDIYLRDRGADPPSPPTGLTALAESGTSIRLDWTDTSSDEQFFQIQRAAGGGAFGDLGTTPENTATYLDEGLQPDTEYRYRVLAVNGVGASQSSNEVAESTLPDLPAAPTGLSVVVLSDTTLRLDWVDASSNEEGFEIQRKTTGDFKTINYRIENEENLLEDGLQPGTTYTYRVRAYNRSGASEFAGPASGKTFAAAAGRLGVVRAVNFGRVRVGTTVTRKVLLRNLDRRAGLRVTLGGSPEGFEVPYAGWSYYLGPGQSVEAVIRFSPKAKGAVRRSWTVFSTDRRAKRVPITLTGVGQLSF